MNKIKFLNTAIAGLFLTSAVTAAELAPSVIISSSGNEGEYSRLVNIINNAVVYSAVTNKVLNGSGDKSFVPVKKTKPMAQILDQLSYFDLYFQKGLQQSRIDKMNLEVHLLPVEDKVAAASNIKMKQTEVGINGLVDAVRPLLKSSIKQQSLAELYSPSNLALVRNSQLMSVKNRYPVVSEESAGSNQLTKSQWMLSAFMPISVSSQSKIDSSSKQFRTSLVFPAIGYPKSLYKNINGGVEGDTGIIPLHMSSRGVKNTVKMQPIYSSQAIFTDVMFYPSMDRRNAMKYTAERDEFDAINASRAMRVELIKNLYSPHMSDLALSFGYLPKTAKSVDSMNMDDVKTKEDARKLVKYSDFGLVIKGDMNFDETIIGNEWIRNKINDYYSSMFDIRLVFHKAYLEMSRIPVQDPSLKYLEQGANVLNLDLFMNKDVGFDLKNLHYNADKSIVNLVISVKPEVQKKIRDGSYFSVDANIRRGILNSFCIDSMIFNANDKINDEQLTNCQLIFSSVDEFKSNFFSKFINRTAVKFLNIELKARTQQEATKAEVMIDEAVEDVMSSLMNELQTAKSYATDILTK